MITRGIDPLLEQLEPNPATQLQPLTIQVLVKRRDDPDTDAATRERIRRVLNRTGGAS